MDRPRGIDYHRYMASREWALKKKAVNKRSGGICERCSKAPVQNVHHLTYERLGDELLDDLQGVCRPCHEFLSAVREDDPAQLPPLKVYLAGKVRWQDWRDSLSVDRKRFLIEGPLTEDKPHNYMHEPHKRGGHQFGIFLDDIVGIDRADAVFTWIDSPDAYGTIWELGYACASDKLVFLGLDRSLGNLLNDLWFVSAGAEASSKGIRGFFDTPKQAWDSFQEWLALGFKVGFEEAKAYLWLG